MSKATVVTVNEQAARRLMGRMRVGRRADGLAVVRRGGKIVAVPVSALRPGEERLDAGR